LYSAIVSVAIMLRLSRC